MFDVWVSEPCDPSNAASAAGQLGSWATQTLTPVHGGWALLQGKWAYRHINPTSMLSGCITGFVSLLVWARIDMARTNDRADTLVKLDYQQALHKTFFEVYDWPPFVIALGFSVVGMVIGMGLDIIGRKVPIQLTLPGAV